MAGPDAAVGAEIVFASVATAPCCGRRNWPGLPGPRCWASTSGKVGFLAEAEATDLDQVVADVAVGNYTVDERMTLEVTAELNGESVAASGRSTRSVWSGSPGPCWS